MASSQGRVFGRAGNRQALNHIEQKGGTEGEVTRQSARDQQRRTAPKASPQAILACVLATRFVMTHIAIQERLGKVVDWMEKVADEQYRNT